MTSQPYVGSRRVPGVSTVVETFENEFTWDRWENHILAGERFSGAARDTGNTGSTQNIRGGLILGKVTASGSLKEWDPTGTDGSQWIYGINPRTMRMTNSTGANQDKMTGEVVMSGGLLTGRLIIPGNTGLGLTGNNAYAARSQLMQRFMLDDDFRSIFTGSSNFIAKATSYAVLDADFGTTFSNAGAAGTVVFTLPATAKAGLFYEFQVVTDQTVTVTAQSAIMISSAAALVTSASYSTGANRRGGRLRVEGDGTNWIATNKSSSTVTNA